MFKYQFLTIVTHKFRTALAGIKWAFDELSREKITIEEKNDLIKNIDQSVRKLVELVDHLAGIAKYDSRLAYAFKAISLREMVDEALGQYGQHIREKDLNLQINTTQDVPLIIADAKKISFVINSLIENAVKYTPKGGQIEVAIKKQSDQIIFSVHNSGKGLGRREKKMLFTKFFRSEAAKLSDPEGLGMALFISKVIVKHHRGQIWAESKGKDKGVTFFVKLKTAQ